MVHRLVEYTAHGLSDKVYSKELLAYVAAGAVSMRIELSAA